MAEYRDQDASDQAAENLKPSMPEKFGELLL